MDDDDDDDDDDDEICGLHSVSTPIGINILSFSFFILISRFRISCSKSFFIFCNKGIVFINEIKGN